MEPTRANAPERTLMDALRARIDAALGELLTPGMRVAHVGYPDHWNTGDPAIWLGEEATLARLGCTVSYRCAWQDYDRALLSQQVGDGPILVAGGGNLGDLWPNHQVFRERVIADFPGNPVIQLPQSLCFQHEENLTRFQRVCASHSRLTLMLRDRASHAAAQTLLQARVMLTPDMAFSLGSQAAPDPTVDRVVPVFWLSRTDKETAGMETSPLPAGWERRDWLEPGEGDRPFWAQAEAVSGELNRYRALLRTGTATSAALAGIDAAYDRLARIRLHRGLRMLSRGRVVLTDRLHGHILSLCLGRPHVLLDNANRKVSGAYETWTHATPLTRLAYTPAEAIAMARQLADNEQHTAGSRV